MLIQLKKDIKSFDKEIENLSIKYKFYEKEKNI
jgi:hypothetical protein